MLESDSLSDDVFEIWKEVDVDVDVPFIVSLVLLHIIYLFDNYVWIVVLRNSNLRNTINRPLYIVLNVLNDNYNNRRKYVIQCQVQGGIIIILTIIKKVLIIWIG